MSINTTPVANRTHIGIFGKRNAGKSSLINALTGQSLAIVSEVAGTTTDPVYKTMELLPLGPIVIIDTAGIDDKGELGKLRVDKTVSVLNKTDIAVYVATAQADLDGEDAAVLELIRMRGIPIVKVRSKIDICRGFKPAPDEIVFSATTGEGIDELKKQLCAVLPDGEKKPLIADLLQKGDNVVLVIPIDEAAPKGRLILPQQQVLRDALEAGAAVTCTVNDDALLAKLTQGENKPRIVITDSQAFAQVSKIVPENVPLTSFSILMARFKGILPAAVEGARSVEKLCDGDTVLISEGCTHHRQCEDIGTVKLPKWIQEYTGKKLNFEFTSGGEFPKELSRFKLIVHCGACMLGEREVSYRYRSAKIQNVPITNYGILIAYINGILQRSISPLGL